MSAKAIRKLSQGFALSLVVALSLLAFPVKAHAASFTIGCGSTPLTYKELGISETYGLCLNTGSGYISDGFTWTSADPSIVSIVPRTQQVVQNIQANALGTTTLTVTYGGESESLVVRVGYRTYFYGAPQYNSILPQITGLPNIATAVTSGQLTKNTQEPFVGVTVTFYENPDKTNEICSGTTNSEGIATCSTLKTYTATTNLYEYFAGQGDYLQSGLAKIN